MRTVLKSRWARGISLKAMGTRKKDVFPGSIQNRLYLRVTVSQRKLSYCPYWSPKLISNCLSTERHPSLDVIFISAIRITSHKKFLVEYHWLSVCIKMFVSYFLLGNWRDVLLKLGKLVLFFTCMQGLFLFLSKQIKMKSNRIYIIIFAKKARSTQ